MEEGADVEDGGAAAAKKARSVGSKARWARGEGKWKVVRRVREARSHSWSIFLSSVPHDYVKELKNTLTEWSTDAVSTRTRGKTPVPHWISVIGSVWSESVQYDVGRSSYVALFIKLCVRHMSEQMRLKEGGRTYPRTTRSLRNPRFRR